MLAAIAPLGLDARGGFDPQRFDSAAAAEMRAVGDRGANSVMRSDAAYRLSFAKDQLPPVDGFWSLTIYEVTPEGQTFLTANPIDRYSIGDRTPGLTTNADGWLDIWISREDPGGARSANWLPAPAQGPFSVTFRTYLPRPAILDGQWRISALQKL